MLSEQSMTACEGKLSLVECYKALQMFSNSKAPGNDGLTADFYKDFWNLLGQQLTDASRWRKTVSSTFQDVEFDRSLLPLFIS